MIQKMKQNLHKTIKLALIVALTFIVCSNVSAMDCSKYKKNGDKIVTDFGISIKESGTNYTITMNPKSSDSKLLAKMRKVTFTVTKITPGAGNGDQLNKKLVYGTPLVLNVQGKEYLEIGGEGIIIKLHSDLNGNGNNLCSKDTKADIELYSYGGYQSEQIIKKVNVKTDKTKLQKVEQGLKIDCGKNYNAESFEAKFCHAKNEAQKHKKYIDNKSLDNNRTMVNFTDAFNSSDFDIDKKYKNLFGSNDQKYDRNFKCKSETKYKYEEIISDDKKYYEENTHYMFGSGTKKYVAGRYKYHFKNNSVTKGDKVQCKITCEEAVVVKYGPPVAQKAGACFQYKIKVESYVTCYMSQAPKEPKVYDEVCSPTPRCTGHNGHVYNQGGPEEEFDKCIKACDNGKYTDKCNKKCYKEIYGDDNNELPLVVESKKTAKEKTLDDEDYWEEVSKKGNSKHSSASGYYKLEGGEIQWRPYGNKGRWYYNHSWGFAGHNYSVIKNGIPKTVVCTDSCKWVMGKCSGKKYFNYGLPEEDYEENVKIYNKAVDKCKAKATCTKTSAVFQISATYRQPTSENGDYTNVTINYPYTNSNAENKDRLSTCNDENKYDTSTKSNTTIIDHGGCYAHSCDDKQNYYMTEWTFPGAWTKKKTGEVSYKAPPETDTSWRSRPHKFCIPKDALQVNRKWAAWYYKYIEKLPSEYYCDDLGSDYNKDKAPTPSSENYNIKGRTIRFGFYEWNISFKCFYAIEGQYSTETSGSGSGSSSAKCEKTKNPDYKIRTVTNSQLFPGQSSSTTTGGTVERASGYNWTSDSKLTLDTVTENYVNDPVKVKKYIEKLGNSIYSSSNANYVDYEFTLTPTNIGDIKDYNKRLSSFDVFCGELGESFIQPIGKDNNITITYYRSNLFRGTKDTHTWANECSKARTNVIAPKKKVDPGCNNNNGNGVCNTSYSY